MSITKINSISGKAYQYVSGGVVLGISVVSGLIVFYILEHAWLTVSILLVPLFLCTLVGWRLYLVPDAHPVTQQDAGFTRAQRSPCGSVRIKS